MNRRAFLRGAGILTTLSAGGATWYGYDRGVFSRGEGLGYGPWEDWGNSAESGLLGLIRAAILAASPHNTQPWRFRVSGSSIELHIDRQRNVGALDPYLREEHIGMGCALENLMLAAEAHGYAATATLQPGQLGEIAAQSCMELVARVDLASRRLSDQALDLASGRTQPSELYRAIPNRHTNRGPYIPSRALPVEFVEELARLPRAEERVKLFLFTEEADRKRIVSLSAAANLELYNDRRVEAASQRWVRLLRRDVERYHDGLTIDAFGLGPGMTALAKSLPVSVLSNMVEKGQKDGYAERMLMPPLIGILAVRDRYDRAQCLEAGRVWQRAHLLATARSIAARPGNEAAERIDYERALGRPANAMAQLSQITGDTTWQPTFVFLMGYPALTAPASPRRGIAEVLDD